MTGPETGTGIVERALAVLAAECASWVPVQPGDIPAPAADPEVVDGR